MRMGHIEIYIIKERVDMRFKKLISGIAALTVASSAFAGLSITANAKTNSVSFNFEDSNAVFTADSRITAAIEANETLGSNVLGFTCASNAQNGYSFAHYDFSDIVKGATSTTIEFDYYNTQGGRAILTLGDASVRGTTGGSSKATYSNTGAAFYLGSNKTNSMVNSETLALADYTNKWMHVSVTVDETVNKYSYSITSGDSTLKSGTDIAFAASDAADVTQIDLFGYINSSHCAMIDNLSITATLPDSAMYDVTYNVEGVVTSETVVEGSAPERIPEDTTKIGYIFKGWTTDGDAIYDADKTYISTEELAATAITAAVTYTAVYEKDADYIEPIVSAVITGPDKMTFGPDPNTAADNEYILKLTGELGSDISAENFDSRAEDFKIVWSIDGFKTENDTENQYCDSYGEIAEHSDRATNIIFKLKDVPMNFYGKMTATVKYNGTTTTAEKYVVALGNTTTATSQILPIGGYPSDFDSYPDSLVGYKAAHETYGNTKDIIVGEWAMSGSDPGTKAEIMAEETNKFMRITSTAISKSHMYTKTIATPATQVIFMQDVRFNSTGGIITLTSKYPFWGNGYTCPVTLKFTGSGLTLNEIAVTDVNDSPATVNSGEWYKIVLSVDKTTSTCFVKVYDAEGAYVGGADNIAWKEESNPTFYSIGLDNSSTGTIDFDNYSAVYPTADITTYEVKASQYTLSIPNGDTADLSASLKTAEGYDITGTAVWSVIEEYMQAGVIITPYENDSHKAKVTLAEGASAGEATVQVNIGGYTKTIVLNITSSAESVKFTKSNTSVSIPLDDNKTTAEYAAVVVDGEGKDLERSITLAIYDKNNTAEYTLPAGITFDAAKGILTVDKAAPACTFTIRATGTNTDGESISKAVKVTVHGLSFDFGTVTDDATAEGYTAVAADTAYTAARGYGIASGTPAAGGTASTENADSDYLEGSFTFKANVTKGKIYTVDITYSGALTTAYVNSDLAGYTLGTQAELAKASYTFAVPTDVLDLTVTDGKIASITVTKNPDRTANAKPAIRHVGDSTAANNGSWAYHIDHNRSSFPALEELATFYNNGAGGRNLCTYYTQGKLAGVLNAIYPGDIVMFGNNGTNGMGSYFEEDVNYYLDAAEAMGAKIIINSYTPHGPVKTTNSDYTYCYDSKTHTFNTWRQDSYDNIVRQIAEVRAANDPNYLGFVEIGKNADEAFNAYVADYAENGYDSEKAAADAIIACFSDHNHYSEGSIARDLMLNGYGDVEGIVAQIVNLLSNQPEPTTYTVNFTGENATVKIDGEAVTSKTVEAGTVVTFTVEPAEGYAVDCVSVGTTNADVPDLALIKPDGNGVYTITVDNNITVNVTTKAAASGKTCTKIVATYGEGGVLSGVTFETVPVEKATETVVEGSTKTMFWDSIAGMKPIK